LSPNGISKRSDCAKLVMVVQKTITRIISVLPIISKTIAYNVWL